MRNQVKFSFQIAVNASAVNASDRLTHHWINLQDSVIKAACTLCGGLTVNHATGYWVDGKTHALRFEGEVEKELCLSFDLTTELDKEVIVYATMVTEIKKIANMFPELKIQWVHCCRTELVGMHFNVTE